MIRALILMALCSISEISANGQDRLDRGRAATNTVYFEAGGPGAFYSLNYTHGFYLNKKFDLCVGAFVSPYFPDIIDEGVDFISSAGLQIQVLYKLKAHEIGLGGAISNIRDRVISGDLLDSYPVEFAHLSYGYTFHNHLYLGASAMLVLFSDGYSVMQPWGSLRVGYRFRKQHAAMRQ